jgi:hypothetical protein
MEGAPSPGPWNQRAKIIPRSIREQAQSPPWATAAPALGTVPVACRPGLPPPPRDKKKRRQSGLTRADAYGGSSGRSTREYYSTIPQPRQSMPWATAPRRRCLSLPDRPPPKPRRNERRRPVGTQADAPSRKAVTPQGGGSVQPGALARAPGRAAPVGLSPPVVGLASVGAGSADSVVPGEQETDAPGRRSATRSRNSSPKGTAGTVESHETHPP